MPKDRNDLDDLLRSLLASAVSICVGEALGTREGEEEA